MNSANIYQLISIDEYSSTPKYSQIINSILKGIEDGKIPKGYVLPSINDLSYELDISRDTCFRVFKELKIRGIVQSIPGKGYFIASTDLHHRLKIFLLFNKLSTHKKMIFDSLATELGDNAAIDFYIYHNDFSLFKELIKHIKEDYSYYVIIAHFLEGGENAYEIINTLPANKLIILDKLLSGVQGEYGAVYENFEKDIYDALEQSLPNLKKYPTLKLIFPDYTYHPKEIIRGFYNFCDQYAFNYQVVNDLANEDIKEGTAYISLMEDDLVILAEKILDSNLVLGQQVGVISYNETPLKKIILNGITTISSDFKAMGKQTAQLILNKSTDHIAIPFKLTLRSSL